MAFENLKGLLYPTGNGSFQFFLQRFLFHKNLLTKQVFRRGEQVESGVGKKPSVQTGAEIIKALDVSVEELIR